MVRDSQVVAVRNDLGADSKPGVARLDDLAGHVDPGDDRVDARDLAVRQRRETVLVVDAGPSDADDGVTVAQLGDGDLPHLAHDGVAVLLRDEGRERGGNARHQETPRLGDVTSLVQSRRVANGQSVASSGDGEDSLPLALMASTLDP